jgi:hypothetical protein
MAMGQAAGTAAVAAAAAGSVPRLVPVDTLRERLARDGALLEPVGIDGPAPAGSAGASAGADAAGGAARGGAAGDRMVAR